MRVRVTEKVFFLAPGQKRINPVLIAAIALAMAGCSHSDESAQFSMAPAPPAFDQSAGAQPYGPPQIMAFSGQPVVFPSNITLSDTGMPGQDAEFYAQQTALRETTVEGKKCSIKDRFDRDAVVAYQWGQNRLSLRARGINLSGEGLDQVKLEYRLRLQPHKSRKEKCRYDSNWQGIIGSGYNEMFVREKDTVWDKIDEFTDQAEDAVDKLF
jgi:hypothetical protein